MAPELAGGSPPSSSIRRRSTFTHRRLVRREVQPEVVRNLTQPWRAAAA